MQTYNIDAIIGDLLECYFVLSSVDAAAVKEMCFTCKGQGICVHLPYSTVQGGWCLRLGSDVTSKLLPRINYYDLTAELVDGNFVTLIYQGTFTVRRKNNKVCEDNENEQTTTR